MEKVTTVTKTEEIHEPIVKGTSLGHTHPHKKPVYETTTRDGSHIVISQDVTNKRNPITDVVTSMATGESIHNEQIGSVIDKTAQTLEIEKADPRLDPQGKKLVEDTKQVLQATEQLLYEKNKEEELQNLMRHGGLSLFTSPTNVVKGILPEENPQLIYENVRLLSMEIIRSKDFRDITMQVLELLTDVLRERKMYSVARENLPTYSRSYVPTPYDSIPSSLPSIPSSTMLPLTEPVTERIVKTVFELKDVGGQPYVEHSVYKERISPVSTTVTAPVNYVTPRAISHGFTHPSESYLDTRRVGETFPGFSNTIECAKREVIPTSQMEYLPYSSIGYQVTLDHYTLEENSFREEIVDRFLRLLHCIGSKQEFHDAMHRLFLLFDSINHSLKNASHKTPFEGSNVGLALADARKLLESFTGKQEMGLFRKHMIALYEDIEGDEELGSWFRDLRRFCSEGIQNDQALESPLKRIEARTIVYRGIDILHREEWVFRFRQIFDDLNSLLDNIKKDSATSNFTKKLEQFMRDFALNEKGRPDLWVMDDSLHQLRLILVPMLRSHLENIPIDRIEMSSHKFDVVIEDLMFSGADILPDHLDLKVKNKVKLNINDENRDKTTHKLKLTVHHIKPTLHNLKFAYKKKTGFPKMEDYGVADVSLKGDGMSIKILWKLISKRGEAAKVELKETKCSIDSLHIHFVKEKTKHDVLDRILVRLLNNTIKRRIANAVAEYLQVKVTQVDDQINRFFVTRPVDKLIDTTNQFLASSTVGTQISNKVGTVTEEKGKITV